ncbi:class I SAM-dependent methyltransferase [Halomonas almeriensis]|uniref:class I SAM-dependent methyltransferase n=1 Tax=Halomonas almeriensis TaxID=308163 RepID=UPI0025B5E452|nr:class I SAM-dependent methyltransferase [Halomonas almeriensis]MDN3554268.1 class I SAM-dependent methyltransferase [Halomonas almeriensis]
MSDGSYFAADWLALREPVDARSRVDHLNQALCAWLADRRRPVTVLDLGAGSGSNLRYLAPRLSLPQQWTLLDHDADLLERARDALPPTGEPLEVMTRLDDMGRWSQAPQVLDAWLDGVDLVTASALLDLVSQSWVETLAAAVATRQAAVLIALSVDGDWWLETTAAQPEEAARRRREDQWMRRHYRAHQASDKGAGTALGGQAPEAMATALRANGYRVEVAESPWRLEAPRDLALGEALLEGWRDAVSEQEPHAMETVRHWHAARRASWQRGELVIRVGHRDLLALPATWGAAHG